MEVNQLHRWPDLSAQGLYLGSQSIGNGKVRFVLLDMDNRGSPEALAKIGFNPVVGSPRYAKGIYYLKGDEQQLSPTLLANSFGVAKCPMVNVSAAEIGRMFRDRLSAKFEENINEVVKSSVRLGQNRFGNPVFASNDGRFIRMSADKVISEKSAQAGGRSEADFLRASDEETLRLCAEGFVLSIQQGAKTTWTDVIRFGRAVFDTGRSDPPVADLHRLQEAIEAAGYRRFVDGAAQPDEAAFKLAEDFYFGLPIAQLRTSESLALQQFSTPMPMSVVGQRILLANVHDLDGLHLLEPTGGNGGLVNLVPEKIKVHALDLDAKRVEAMRETGRIDVALGDAVTTDFRRQFKVDEGFDLMICNPPFGQMDQGRAFDVLPNVRKLDHYIPLKALEARKDRGMAVLIVGADEARSDGTVKGGSKHFLAYLHDYYEVHGAVELDGRMYSRHGAGYNVRMIVVGDRRAEPVETNVPDKLPVLTGYDELWHWSTDVIQRIELNELGRVLAGRSTAEPEEPRVLVTALAGENVPLFDADGEAIRERSPVVESIGDTPTSQGLAADEDVIGMPVNDAVVSDAEPDIVISAGGVQKAPWAMSSQEWNDEMALAASNTERAEFLKYGVNDWAKDRLRAAKQGEIELSESDLIEIAEQLDTAVKHRDVVVKAQSEGKNIPLAVVKEYPDLVIVAPRRVNEFQTPYQAASQVGLPSTMVPINMASSTYAALNDLETRHGAVDEYVATKLNYSPSVLGEFYSPEQVDALALAIRSVEQGRGIINADQTGIGKGRFVAAMLRYAKLEGKTPIFLTIKPDLYTDIFRDVADSGSLEMFKKVFIFNDGENVRRFGSETEVLFPATTPLERKKAIETGVLEDDVDMVLATYSQFMRPFDKNPKARLLREIAANNGMLVLDEAHVASGASNLSKAVGEAVEHASSVVYASATPLKGVTNFMIYNKVFPSSVDLTKLADTLKAGGEALQEAISTNMARDGVLIRREHDFSQLTFHTRRPTEARRDRNIALANELSAIITGMSYLAGDVAKSVASLNNSYKKEFESVPEDERVGCRMQASSMNFGSRLYNINRQFLLGIKVDDAIEASITAIQEGRKPVIAVENTGESLLRQVISRRAGIESLEIELEELEELGDLTPEQTVRRESIKVSLADALRNVVLDEPPQFRELLEIMLDRIGVIKVMGRYGDVSRVHPDSEEYEKEVEYLREKIRAFPDLPLTPIDVIKKALNHQGFPVGEVTGRKVSLSPGEVDREQWNVRFHPKADGVANVAAFQSGKFDAIIISRSGSTGISLHATDRFEDSDIRQREFIVLQKASNIAEFLQWLGRVNRKDQVVPPVITTLESDLPAELRLTMMHNSKLRKLSANTTSNRDNANLEGDQFDLLNDVGERVALSWLIENPDMAEALDIDLPKEDDETDFRSSASDCPYVNRMMGRLLMVPVDRQEAILKAVNERFATTLEELEQRGENPFKVDVYDWSARAVKEEELQSGVIRAQRSSFDEPVTLTTLQFEETVKPIRVEKLLSMVKAGQALFREMSWVDDSGSLEKLRKRMSAEFDRRVREQLPKALREQEASLEDLLANDKAVGANNAAERARWLMDNVKSFRPGARLTHTDLFKGERIGVITSLTLPGDQDIFMLSQYRAKVVFPGDSTPSEITLATVRAQGHDLASTAYQFIDTDAMAKYDYMRDSVNRSLASYDMLSDGVVTRTQHVLRGNIYRACELASTQRLGYPILYSDDQGNRQRAILIREKLSPEMVKSMPVGLEARDMVDYVDEYLNPAHPQHFQRSRFGGFVLFDSPVKSMSKGEGIQISVLNGGTGFRLTVPGSKRVAGALITDGALFDIGERTPDNSLRLRLAGNRKFMEVDFPRNQLGAVLERLERGKHVGRFYVPTPDHDVLAALKERFEANSAADYAPC